MQDVGDKNLIIIGMPGAGKSVVGKRLAHVLSLPFLDTDQLMEERWGCSLQEMIDSDLKYEAPKDTGGRLIVKADITVPGTGIRKPSTD